MGASIAFHLAQRKPGSTIVLDSIMWGMGRVADPLRALIRMRYSFAPEVQLAVHVQQWRQVVGEAGDFRKIGFVRIVHPDESQRLKLNVEVQWRLGVKVQMTGREDEGD
jgi:hypothetical protein